MKIEPDSQDVATANGVKHAEAIRTLLIRYMERLLSPKLRCDVTIDPAEGIITLGDTGITVDPMAIGDDRKPGWNINHWVTVHNYPHSPDDIDCETIDSATTPWDAARFAMSAMWASHAASLYIAEDEEAMATEMSEDGLW